MPGAWLADKYAILGQHAAAAQTAASAQKIQALNEQALIAGKNDLMGGQASEAYGAGRNYDANAGKTRAEGLEVPANAAAARALQASEGSKNMAEGGYYGAVGGAATLRAPAEAAQAYGSAASSQAQAGAIGQESRQKGFLFDQGNQPSNPNPGGDPASLTPRSATDAPPVDEGSQPDDGTIHEQGFAKGTSKVPAKGGGKGPPGKAPPGPPGKGAGMVPANLSPGEAVLNPGAAAHMGRGLIGALNMASHAGQLSSQGTTLGGSPHAGMPQSIGAIPGLPSPAGGPPGAGGPPPPGGPPQGPPGFSKGTEDVEEAPQLAPPRIEDLAGDNSVRMGPEPKEPGYAKGTANVPSQGAIGKDYQGSLGQGPGKPTPSLSFKKGTADVPGKPTHPSVDTQPSKLPVGGAVLTNDAANHVGRGLIAHLNAVHAGMPPPHPGGIPPALMQAAHAAQGGPSPMMMGHPPGGPPPMAGGPPMAGPPIKPGFAEGTSDVAPETNGQHLWNSIKSYGAGMMAPAADMYNSWAAGGGGPAMHPMDSYSRLNAALTPPNGQTGSYASPSAGNRSPTYR